MDGSSVEFFAVPSAMTRLPASVAPEDVPTDRAELRNVVQGLLVHRDWAAAYGIESDQVRSAEQNLRSTAELLDRAFELSNRPITDARPPLDRVLCICRHFTLLHTALLRAHGTAARVRCGFSNYFDRSKWYDHWITEWWNGDRWVREDPQIDELQADVINLDFDPYDQPAGQFLSGDEAWRAIRAGDLDPNLFGIFDMWGQSFIAGNLLSDLACLNKVELLPWDDWGMRRDWGPHDSVPEAHLEQLDELAVLMGSDAGVVIRERYEADERLRVPALIATVAGGEVCDVTIDLD